jgi:cell pole-organizing protein PopZ
MGEMNQDPSMEEILASIKRVIAEDGKAARPARGSRPAEAPPAEEMLQKRQHDSYDGDGIQDIAEEDILELDDPVLEGSETLVSQDVADASRQSLAALLALRDDAEPARAESPNEGPLEAVVRDMLRPLLKDWLDRNLPDMVEALVTREIARITGQRL